MNPWIVMQEVAAPSLPDAGLRRPGHLVAGPFLGDVGDKNLSAAPCKTQWPHPR